MYADPFAESLVSDRSPVMSGKVRLSPESGSELVSQLVFPEVSESNWVLTSPTQTSDAGRTRSSSDSVCDRSCVSPGLCCRSVVAAATCRREILRRRNFEEFSESRSDASLIHELSGIDSSLARGWPGRLAQCLRARVPAGVQASNGRHQTNWSDSSQKKIFFERLLQTKSRSLQAVFSRRCFCKNRDESSGRGLTSLLPELITGVRRGRIGRSAPPVEQDGYDV